MVGGYITTTRTKMAEAEVIDDDGYTIVPLLRRYTKRYREKEELRLAALKILIAVRNTSAFTFYNTLHACSAQYDSIAIDLLTWGLAEKVPLHDDRYNLRITDAGREYVMRMDELRKLMSKPGKVSIRYNKKK